MGGGRWGKGAFPGDSCKPNSSAYLDPNRNSLQNPKRGALRYFSLNLL